MREWVLVLNEYKKHPSQSASKLTVKMRLTIVQLKVNPSLMLSGVMDATTTKKDPYIQNKRHGKEPQTFPCRLREPTCLKLAGNWEHGVAALEPP